MITYRISPYKQSGIALLFADFNTGYWRDFSALIIDMDEYTIDEIRSFQARAELRYREVCK